MNTPPLFGPYGSGALAYAGDLARFWANACWFHGFDAAAFEACERHGLEPCVEFKTFRANFDERPELIPIGADGQPIRYGSLVQGVCLSRKEFLEETETSLIDGVRGFSPTGIWLDYLTYAGWFEMPVPDLQESCFCTECIAEFCDSTGTDADTPEAILSGHQAEWTEHKCRRIAAFGARYAGIIRRHLPGCAVGAYMCPWTPEESDGALTRIFAQDYERLSESIDVFTPLIYAKKSGRPASWGRGFLERCGRFIPAERKVQPILDVLDFPDSLIETAKSAAPAWGIQLFGGAEVFADEAKGRLFQEAVGRIREAAGAS